MALSFFIPFAIALVAALVAYQSQEEVVKVFSAIMALIALVLSFILAPWLVQILILISGLAGIRYFRYHHSCQNLIES